MINNTKKLSVILKNTFDPSKGETQIKDIISELDHCGMAVVLVLFSIPSALPIPAAGYSTILSLPLFLIGFRILMGHKTAWMPEVISRKKINRASFAKVIDKMLKLVSFFEKISKPRLHSVVHNKIFNRALGIIVIALASSMALPIPGTNTLPAGGIFLIGFSLLEEDGLLTIAGILYSIVAICVSILVIYFGYEVVKLGIKEIIGLV